MLTVVEAFSGIGSQAKALSRIGVEYRIQNIVEWDVHAIFAYDIIHNGPQDITNYLPRCEKKDLLELIAQYELSLNGKTAASDISFRNMSENALRHILFSIERTRNLVNITKVHGADLPRNLDLLTYSFPCQDLSVCGSWHGNMEGINRDAQTRSGLLWEIERIMMELHHERRHLPKFLLMENVNNIMSKRHLSNFQEWQDYLASIGYFNQIYTLNAKNFGIPQHRKRTFMLSVRCTTKHIRKRVEKYFRLHNLEALSFPMPTLDSFLRTCYENPVYREEADESNPCNTPSRQEIYRKNIILHDGKKAIADCALALTTKQDRNPNSGLIKYTLNADRAPYRNLTPRECFLLMGFDESDFQLLVENDFIVRKGRMLFAREKYTKMTGNSIVVNVLEAIFRQVFDLKAMIWPERQIVRRNDAAAQEEANLKRAEAI